MAVIQKAVLPHDESASCAEHYRYLHPRIARQPMCQIGHCGVLARKYRYSWALLLKHCLCIIKSRIQQLYSLFHQSMTFYSNLSKIQTHLSNQRAEFQIHCFVCLYCPKWKTKSQSLNYVQHLQDIINSLESFIILLQRAIVL